MRKRDSDKVLEALDTLALALVDHKHKWTKKEKNLYQKAVSIMEQLKLNELAKVPIGGK